MQNQRSRSLSLIFSAIGSNIKITYYQATYKIVSNFDNFKEGMINHNNLAMNRTTNFLGEVEMKEYAS